MVYTANTASQSNSTKIRKEAEIFLEYLQLFDREKRPANIPISGGSLLFVLILISFYYYLLFINYYLLFIIFDSLFLYLLYLVLFYYLAQRSRVVVASDAYYMDNRSRTWLRARGFHPSRQRYCSTGMDTSEALYLPKYEGRTVSFTP
jgi:hypothetical protein